MSSEMTVRPEGANYQWRRNPPGELPIDPVAQNLVASQYPPAVAPIRDRAAAFRISTLDRTDPPRMLSCWSLRCQLSHANLINGWIRIAPRFHQFATVNSIPGAKPT